MGLTYLDSVEHFWVEKVDTGVDPVADKLHWLFDESVNRGRVGFRDDHSIVGRFCNLGDHDGTFTTVCHVKVAKVRGFRGRDLPERFKGIRAGDICVEDKEGTIVFAKDITGEGKRTSWTSVT